MFQLPSPLEKINIHFKNNIQLYIKRDDLIHPYISGNKWRKLKYNINTFLQSDKKILVTVGGAYSNHIMATAAATKVFNISSIGIIRGNELNQDSNNNLKYASEQGMKLIFAERNFYAQRYNEDFIKKLADYLKLKSDKIFFVPEGGANAAGVKGCEEIVQEINIDFDYILTDCGTGTTLAGIANSLKPNQKVTGISVINSGYDLKTNINQFTTENYELKTEFNFGGYAKTNEELFSFIKYFYAETNIKLDYVYTGKLFYAIFKLIEQDYFEPDSVIVGLHTGGVLNATIFNDL